MAQLQNLQRQQIALTQRLQTSQTALALVAYPERRTLSMTGKATRTLVLNSEKSGVLFAWGLDSLDEAHTYQVWLIQPDGRRVSGGLFRPEPGQGGVRVEDDVVITLSGSESLTTFGRELRVIRV
jgi:hypothetical protein